MRDAQRSLIPFWVTLLAQLPSSDLLKLSPMRPCKVGAIDTSQQLSWEIVPQVLAVGYPAELIEAVPCLLRITKGCLTNIHPQLSSAPFLWVWPERRLQSHCWFDLGQALQEENVAV